MRTKTTPNSPATSRNSQTGRITPASTKCLLCGIPHKRHTFGTRMIARAEIRRVQEWMGHADIQTTMKYLHYAPRREDAELVALAFGSESRAASHEKAD